MNFMVNLSETFVFSIIFNRLFSRRPTTVAVRIKPAGLIHGKSIRRWRMERAENLQLRARARYTAGGGCSVFDLPLT